MIALAPVVADPRLAIDDQRVDLQLLQPCGRSQGRPGRRRPPARPDRGRHSRRRRCAGRASSARESRANRPARADATAELLLEALRVRRARSAASTPSAGRRRRHRARAAGCRCHGRAPVSKSKIASMVLVPARVTRRGGARFGAILKSCAARPCGASAGSSCAIANAADERLEVPAQRQHVAPVTVGDGKGDPSASRSASVSAPSNSSSQACGGDGNILRPVQHARPRGRLRGVSSAVERYTIGSAHVVTGKRYYPASDSMWPCSGGRRPFSVSR